MTRHRLRMIGLERQRLIRPGVIVDRRTAAPARQVRLFTVRPEVSAQPLPLVGSAPPRRAGNPPADVGRA